MRVYKKLKSIYNQLSINIKATIWFLFANIYQKLIMFLFTPIFSRIMTTEEYSKYAVFQSWEAILAVFATLNISSYSTAKALVDIKNKNNKENFIATSEFLTFLLCCITFIAYYELSEFFTYFRELPVLIMISMFFDIFFISVFNFWSQYERFFVRYKLLVFFSIIIGTLSPLIGLFLILYSSEIGLYKGWARIVSSVFINSAVGLFLLSYFIKFCSHKISFKYCCYILKYCIPLIPHFVSMALLQKVSQLFVDSYHGGYSSGIYSLAFSLSLMMMVFNDALTKTLIPWTYKKLSNNQLDQINSPILYSLVIIAILDLFLALFSPEIVFIFAPSNFYDAIYAIPPLVGVCFFSFLYNAYSNIEYYYQQNKLASIASIVAGIFIVLLELITVPKYGYLGAAYSSLASFIILSIMHLIGYKLTLSKNDIFVKIYNNSIILFISVLFVICLIIVTFLFNYPFFRILLICVILVFLIYFCKFKSSLITAQFCRVHESIRDRKIT